MLNNIREVCMQWLSWLVLVEWDIAFRGVYLLWLLGAIVVMWLVVFIYYRLPKVKARKIPKDMIYHNLLYRLPVIKTIGRIQFMRGNKLGATWGLEEGYRLGGGRGSKLKQRKIARALKHAGLQY